MKANQKKALSDVLFILWAGGAALLSYSLVYALRKPFTAATFDGLDFFGMDYKTATSIVQIAGYFLSKLIGIKVISEMKKENRLKFIIASVAVAELSLVLFGALPRPYNVFALFFNGLSLGCMWGVIFSFLEGRRVTDLLASLMGLSIAISSGTAKSLGLFVMNGLHVSEFWMPAFIGAFAFPLLSLLGWAMTRLPHPTKADMELRTERVALDRKGRSAVFKSFMPVLLMLFFANLFITVLQDLKEDFLVKIIDVKAAGLSSWAFAKIDATVTLVILILFAAMSMVKSNVKVLCLLLALVTCGCAVLSSVAFNYEAWNLPVTLWLFLQSLCLYTVYLSFQTLFFERFIACFRIKATWASSLSRWISSVTWVRCWFWCSRNVSIPMSTGCNFITLRAVMWASFAVCLLPALRLTSYGVTAGNATVARRISSILPLRRSLARARSMPFPRK